MNKPPLPRAAHEKIAADLAHDLDLPLPPCLLHRWPAPPAGCDELFAALSLFPFLNVHKWQVIRAVPALEAQLKLELRSAASALVAFDTWLDNRDRVNDGNLLVSKATQDQTPVKIAYIDYSYTLSHGWRNGGYANVVVAPIYPTDQKDADIAAMEAYLTRIENFANDDIRGITERIHDDFLLPQDKKLIVDGLIDRKPRLRAALKSVYGGLR